MQWHDDEGMSQWDMVVRNMMARQWRMWWQWEQILWCMENKMTQAADNTRTKERNVKMCGWLNSKGNLDSTMEHNNKGILPKDATIRTTIWIKCRKIGSKWKVTRPVNHKTMNWKSTTAEGTKEVRAQKISRSLEMTMTQICTHNDSQPPFKHLLNSTFDVNNSARHFIHF